MKKDNKIKMYKKSKISIIITIMFLCCLVVVKRYESGKIIDVMAVNNWGLSFQKNNQCPTIDYKEEDLTKREMYYLGNQSEKKLYLTFDAGFENGNTGIILDALKENNVKACFFLVGNYLEKEPELVKRIVEEGHIIGNHTYHHKDMEKITNKDEFIEELESLENKFIEITGKELNKYYRPPQGKFTTEQIDWAREKGYKTIFWSLAYVDWEEDNQPSREEAIKKLTDRIHPGAIILLHSTSKTNGVIMDEIIKKWKDMGYTFGTLEEL